MAKLGIRRATLGGHWGHLGSFGGLLGVVLGISCLISEVPGWFSDFAGASWAQK